MLEHHKQSIERLLQYFEEEPGIIAVVLGGSIAKGCERPDSDVDALVVVTEEQYTCLQKENRLAESIHGHCTYEGGYFDIKYCTKAYLKALAERGSEPSRNAYLCAKCLRSSDPEIGELIARIPVFQKAEQADKMLSFYASFRLSCGYFWNMSWDNTYLRTRAMSDIVLFGLRLVLQENEVLFPCHKALLQAVGSLKKGAELLEHTNRFLTEPSQESKDAFETCILNSLTYQPPEYFPEVLTRYTEDNELWWYKQRPCIAEW